MKIWPWNTSPDYAVKVGEGSRGKWRWSLIHQGDTVALSPVKGWDTAEEARDAAYKVLADIGASHVTEDTVSEDES